MTDRRSSFKPTFFPPRRLRSRRPVLSYRLRSEWVASDLGSYFAGAVTVSAHPQRPPLTDAVSFFEKKYFSPESPPVIAG